MDVTVKREGFAEPTETEADRAYEAGHSDGLEGHPLDPVRADMGPARSTRARALAMLYVRAYNRARQERMQRLFGDLP